MKRKAAKGCLRECVSNRSLIRWLVLVVVILGLLNLPETASGSLKAAFRETTRPLQRFAGMVVGSAVDFIKSIGRIPGLLRENNALALEVARLSAEQGLYESLQKENEELRDLLDFKARSKARLVPAKVLARTSDGWWQTVRINKGSADGVTENMAVISTTGLVGKVTAVSRNTADILLISDLSFRLTCRILRTGSFGVVSGRGPSWQGEVFCRMEFIDKDSQIKPGDEVVSSGIGGVFPENIPIGYIDRVSRDPSGLYLYADMVTTANLNTLLYVFVLIEAPADQERNSS